MVPDEYDDDDDDSASSRVTDKYDSTSLDDRSHNI